MKKNGPVVRRNPRAIPAPSPRRFSFGDSLPHSHHPLPPPPADGRAEEPKDSTGRRKTGRLLGATPETSRPLVPVDSSLGTHHPTRSIVRPPPVCRGGALVRTQSVPRPSSPPAPLVGVERR